MESEWETDQIVSPDFGEMRADWGSVKTIKPNPRGIPCGSVLPVQICFFIYTQYQIKHLYVMCFGIYEFLIWFDLDNY